MESRQRSPNRGIGVALICLMVLAHTSCTTLPMSPSLTPDPGQTEPTTSPDGGSGGSAVGNVVAIASLVMDLRANSG